MAKNHTPLKISLRQYVDNVTGKGSAYVAARYAIKQGLNLQFIELLRSYRNHFMALPYILNNGDLLYHVRIPSSMYKDNKIAYDVLFLVKNDPTLRTALRDIQVFSNSPSFIFTYCYVYNQKDMLIPMLKSRLPEKALNDPPEIRNPIESMGFEKSTYIAARYLIDGGCLTDQYISRFGKPFTPVEEINLLRRIADPEVLVTVYQHTLYKMNKNKRKKLTAATMKKRDDLKTKMVAKNKREYKTGFMKRSPKAKLTAKRVIKKVNSTFKK